MQKLPYDSLTSFTPIGLICAGGTAIVAHPSVPANSLAELIKLARTQPGKLSYGTSGVAGAGHMAAELLQIAAQVQMVHIVYKGGGPAMTDLLGGHVPMLFASMATAVPHVKSGKIKGLAVTTPARGIGYEPAPGTPEQFAAVIRNDLEKWRRVVQEAKIKVE